MKRRTVFQPTAPAPLVTANRASHVRTALVFFDLATTLWAFMNCHTASPILVPVVVCLFAVAIAMKRLLATFASGGRAFATLEPFLFGISNVEH